MSLDDPFDEIKEIKMFNSFFLPGLNIVNINIFNLCLNIFNLVYLTLTKLTNQ